MKESLGLEKKTTVSKALAESSNFRENKTELKVPPWCSGPVASTCDLSPLPKTSHPLFNYKCHLITQNVLPDEHFPYRFHKPPFKYEASLIPLMLSLVLRPTVALPCLNKGNLPPLRLSLLFFCLGPNYTLQYIFLNMKREAWFDFLKFMKIRTPPGGPVVKIPSFHCRGYRFDHWLEN